MSGLDGIDVAVLAGGLGTRIRSVLGDVPKVLAPIGGRPFLDHLLDWLGGFGARRVVLCLGHRAEPVLDHIAARAARDAAAGLTVIGLVEPEPMGTAGAIRFARPHLLSDPVFVMNGDTFLDADLPGFVARHRAANAAVSMLCAAVPSIARFGSVELDGRGFVARFVEKDPGNDRPGLINGGVYLFSPDALDALEARPGPSLERDVLQALPPETIRAEVTRGRFIDIGTPESLAAAVHILPSSEERPGS